MTYTILFVCSGNTCRSPMAEGILRDFLIDDYSSDQVKVHSAGTLGIMHAPATQPAIIACRELEVDISEHLSKGLTTDMLTDADLVLCMAHHHKSDILSVFPQASDKTFLLKEFAGINDGDPEIEDPIGGSQAVYNASRDDIYEAIKAAVPDIKNRINAAGNA